MNSCGSNTFGNKCGYNTFGNSCGANTFGDGCSSNTFGNNCANNTFGIRCESNTFGNNCISNKFIKDYMNFNIVENGNMYITVTSRQTTSQSSILRNFTIAQGVNNTTNPKTISHNTVNDIFKTTYQNPDSKTADVV